MHCSPKKVFSEGNFYLCVENDMSVSARPLKTKTVYLEGLGFSSGKTLHM